MIDLSGGHDQDMAAEVVAVVEGAEEAWNRVIES